MTPGTVFAGDYRIERPLSQGGMGAVFVAQQLSTGKLRALKLMHQSLLYDADMRRRFEQEARVGSRIASEHIVEVQAAGLDAATGTPYIVMELLEGEDLATRLRRGAVPLAETHEILEQLAHALGAAHDAGVVHRDLKPDNVFLAVSHRIGASRMVKVLDFGIAKVIDEVRRTTAGYGTPLWLAPEQMQRGHVSAATDVWSFALVTFAMITGHSFWRSAEGAHANIAMLAKEIMVDPIPLASSRAAEYALWLPEGLDLWFQQALARDPAMRFPNVRAAFAALAPLLKQTDTPVTSPPPPKRSSGAVWVLLSLVTVLIGGAVAIGAYFLRSEPPLRGPPKDTSAASVAPLTSAVASAVAMAFPAPSASSPAQGSPVVSGMILLTDDATRDINTLAIDDATLSKVHECIADHPGGKGGAMMVTFRVAADGHPRSSQALVTAPDPASSCVSDAIKANVTSFAKTTRGSQAMLSLSWKR